MKCLSVLLSLHPSLALGLQVENNAGAPGQFAADEIRREAAANLTEGQITLTGKKKSKADADLGIARDWRPGTLKDDGKRGGTEKGCRESYLNVGPWRARAMA